MSIRHKSPVVFRTLILIISILLIAGSVFAQNGDATPAGAPWSYTGSAGPENWGTLSDAYELCSTGQAQSPIDIQTTDTTSPADLQFNYLPDVMTVENVGYSVQVDFAKGGGIVLDGMPYTLGELHFHQPSEHTIDGKASLMEAQFVHSDADKNVVIVSVLFDKGPTNFEPLISLWRLMHSLKPERWTVLGITADASVYIPSDHSYYSYLGSLTTPPCTENVRWIVMKTPQTMSAWQLSQFQGVFVSSGARPVQPLNDREVTLYSDN